MKESQRNPKHGNLPRLAEDRRKAEDQYRKWEKIPDRDREHKLREFEKMHKEVCKHGERQRAWWRKEGKDIKWKEGR